MGVDKIQVSVLFDQLHKTACKNEENCRIKWRRKFDWLVAEILKSHDELEEISKLAVSPHRDARSLKPVPNTSNGFYGWVATKKDFQLQIFGTDVMNTIPLPKEDFLNDV